MWFHHWSCFCIIERVIFWIKTNIILYFGNIVLSFKREQFSFKSIDRWITIFLNFRGCFIQNIKKIFRNVRCILNRMVFSRSVISVAKTQNCFCKWIFVRQFIYLYQIFGICFKFRRRVAFCKINIAAYFIITFFLGKWKVTNTKSIIIIKIYIIWWYIQMKNIIWMKPDNAVA